jgi:hypothetical protein
MTLSLTTGTSQPAADDFVFRAVHRSTISGHERVLRLTDLNAKVGGIVSVKEYGAVGDGVTDDTAAFSAALAASPCIFIPRAASSYILKDLPTPSGARFIGQSLPIYSAYNDASYTVGHSTLRMAPDATNLILPAINSSFENIIFEGVDATRNMLGKNAGAQVQRIRFIQCGMHRFLRAIYQASYCKEVFAEGCMISACGTGIRDVIDSIIKGCYIHANTGDGVQLNSGANDNQFLGNKIEFNGEDNFQASSNSVRNLIIGGIIDAATENGVACTDAELQVVGVELRRNGRGGSHWNLYVNGARRLIVTNVNGSIGKNDDGSGVDTPTSGVRIIGTGNKIVIADGDFSASTTPLSIDGSATFTHFRVKNVIGMSDRDTGAALLVSDASGQNFTEHSDVPILTTATGTYAITRPAVSTFSRAPMVFDVIGRKTTTGGTAQARWEGCVTREGAGATISSATMTGRQILGTSFQTTLGTASGTIRVNVTSVATDGSTFNITIENTDSVTWNFWVVVRPA